MLFRSINRQKGKEQDRERDRDKSEDEDTSNGESAAYYDESEDESEEEPRGLSFFFLVFVSWMTRMVVLTHDANEQYNGATSASRRPSPYP